MDNYSTIDIERILGIKRKRLLEWIDGTFVKPSIAVADGMGTKNIFNTWDLYGFEIYRRLLETDVSRSKASMFFLTWSEYTKSLDISKRENISKAILWHYIGIVKLDDGIHRGHLISPKIYTKEEEKDISFQSLFDIEERSDKILVRVDIIDVADVIKHVDSLL